MKTKTLLLASLTLNALLVAAGIYVIQQDVGDLSSTPPLVVCVSHGRNGTAEPDIASAVSSTNLFAHPNWRRIQSEEYAQYVARLRALGCPEQTVGDIVAADVNAMFHRRAEKDVYTATSFAP